MFGTEGELEIILESECVVKVELCCVTVVLFCFFNNIGGSLNSILIGN